MAKIAKSLTDLIGHTPLLETKNYIKVNPKYLYVQNDILIDLI